MPVPFIKEQDCVCSSSNNLQPSRNYEMRVDLEKCDGNAIHAHANLWQPVPAKVGVGTCPERRVTLSSDK